MGVSSGSGAANKAAQNEAWNTGQTNRTVDQINSIYGGAARQNDINDFLGASQQYYRQQLDDQKDTADRSLKFAMARSGLSGGSAAVDANTQLGKDYQQGILNADRLAQSAASNLSNADETSRLNLISQAASGLGLTSGASQAASSLQNNLQSAQGGLDANALGDVFSGITTIAANSRSAAEARRAQQDYYGNMGGYTPMYGFGGGR